MSVRSFAQWFHGDCAKKIMLQFDVCTFKEEVVKNNQPGFYKLNLLQIKNIVEGLLMLTGGTSSVPSQVWEALC